MSRYLAIVQTWAKANFSYRADVIGRMIAPIAQMYLLVELWGAVYGERQNVPGMLSQGVMMTYLVMVNLQAWVIRPVIHFRVADTVRSGQLTAELLRPVSYPGQVVAYQAGFTLGNVPSALVAVGAAAFTGALAWPVSPIYPLSLALAYVVSTLLALLLGMTALWTVENTGPIWLYTIVATFLGGGYIPLDLLPGMMRTLFEVLPFQAASYAPIAIYVGLLEGEAAWRALAVQAVWAIVLLAAAVLVWRRARVRLIVQGG